MNIEPILSSDAHWNVNKKLASIIGIVPTVLLMELVFCRRKYGQAEFFESSEKIEKSLGITKEHRRKILDSLVSFEVISYEKKGNPARFWYKINDQKIADLLFSELETQPSSELGLQPTRELKTQLTIIKNINKNINKNIQSSIFRNTEDDVSKLNILSTINNKEEVPRIEGSEETDPRPPIESPKNHDRIDVEKNLGAELGKGSQNNEESLKIETIRERDNFMQQLSGINSVVRGNPPPELVEFIDSKQKLAKPIIDAFYGYFKTLNNSYGQEMKWDAKETKILKTQLLEAGIPIDRLLMWKPDFRSQDNPYYQVLEPAWRLKISRDKKNSDFFKKIFRPSTFTVKYTECLEPINYYKETVEEEDPNLDSKLEELNKKLTGG